MQLVVPINERAIERRYAAFLHTESHTEKQIFQMRMDLAGLERLTLEEHVARLQALLVKFNIAIRVVIIRYFKSLIAFVWTVIMLTLCLAVVKQHTVHRPGSYPTEYWCLFFGFIWASLAPLLVALPLVWVTARGDQNKSLRRVRRDPHLIGFERTVLALCLTAAFASSVGLWEYHLPENQLYVLWITVFFGILGWTALGVRLWWVIFRRT